MKKYLLIKDFERRGKVAKVGTVVELSPENAQIFMDGGFIESDNPKPTKKKTTKKKEEPKKDEPVVEVEKEENEN